MTTANIVLSARDTTKAAFASLDASLRGAGQRLDALNGTVQGFLGLGAVAVFTAGLRGAVNELDRLGDTAPKIGLTTQSLAELGFAAKLSGTDAATLEGAIGKLSTRMADAAGGSKEAAAVFSALGIKVKDATGSLKSGDVVLGEIADKFSTFSDGPERAALAVEIFGKSGRELIPLLTQGSKGIDGLRSEFRALAGDDLGAAAQAAGLFNDSLDRLQTSTGRFSRQILEATLPALTDLVNGLVTTEQSTRNVNVVAEALATVLETVSVVGANVSYVIKQVGNEIGGLAAQAVALATLDLNGFKAIGEAMKADAKSAREAVDAYSAGVLRARELATTLAGIDKSYQALENRRLGGGSASPTQTAPIISKPTTEAQTAYKSISAELEKQAKLLAAQSELGRNLTDGEKFRIDIIERITSEATKLTASERAALLIQAERVANLKDEEERRQKNVKLAQQAYAAEVEFEEERARAEVEASRARESARAYVQDILLATEEQTRLLELEAGLVNATEQQRGFALEKLRIELQLRKEILEVQRRLQFDAAAQQEAIDRLNADAQAKIANAQKRSILDEFNRTTAQISDSLTDALLRGFESGKGFVRNFVDTLKNLFKTLVLTPTIKAIIQPVAGALTGAFGLNGVANAGGIDSVFGTASNVASIANLTTSVSSLVTIGSQVASGAMSVANALGTVFANSTGTGISGLLATNGAFGTAAAGSTAATTSSALSSAAAAGPYVLAAVAALNALGVFRSRKIVDGGLQGELGGQINDYALERRGGTLFNGPSYRVLDRGVSAQNDELQKAYSAIRTTVAGMAEQLGIGNDAIKAFTVQLGNDLIHPDTGGFGIKTQGLTQDEIVKKIEAALVSANEQLAAFALGTTEFTRNGETAAQTMARLAGSLQTVNSTFDLLGLTLADASLAGADAASKFVELFGGVEQFGQVTSSYYANFYTEAERTANTVEALRQRFYELGVNGATTREEFRAMVEEQQRLRGATSPVVAELLKLSDTFASVVPAIDAVSEAAAKQAEQAQLQAAAINSERSDRLRIERETAAAAKAASEELAKLSEQNYRLAISAGNVSAAMAARGNNGPRFADFQGANGFNAAGYNLASIFSQQRSAEEILAETRRQNPFAVADFFGVVRELENTIASLQANIDSGEFTGGVSSTEQAAQLAFGDFLSADQIQAAADGLTSFSSVLSLVTGTAQAGAVGADQALRVLEGAYTGASKQSAEYARGLDIIGNSVGVFTGNVQDIQAAIKAGLDYMASGEYYQAIAQEALRQQVNFTGNAFRNLTARAASFNTEAEGLETSFDVLDGFIGRLKSVQDAFANAAGDRAVEAGLISDAARRISEIITTPVAEAARNALADLPSFAGLDDGKLRDLSLLLKDLGQFDNAGLEKTFIRVSEALASGTVTGEQYAALIEYTESVYLGTATALNAVAEAGAAAADILREREGLELRILQLQGNTAELRRRELEALDPSNRAFQEFIYLLEDQARLEADATRLADAFGSIRDSVRDLIDGLVIDSQRSFLSPSQILGEAERQYRMNLAGAFEGDTQAAGQLGGSVNALLEAARNSATSEVDYNRTFGRTVGDLRGLESFAEQRATTDDVVAELRAVRAELAEVNKELDAQRAELRAGMAQIASNTGKTKDQLQGWTVNGLPATET